MAPIDLLILGRIIERTIICISAGVSMTLGWSLFRAGIAARQQASIAAAGWKVDLKNVGPGVFFALFGAIVLSLSLHSPLSVDIPSREQTSRQVPQSNPSIAEFHAQYDVPLNPAVSKRWVASLNTSLQLATPEHFGTDAEKDVIRRANADLESLRNSLVIAQFGSDAFSQYLRNEAKYDSDPSAFGVEDRARFEEIGAWMKASRITE